MARAAEPDTGRTVLPFDDRAPSEPPKPGTDPATPSGIPSGDSASGDRGVPGVERLDLPDRTPVPAGRRPGRSASGDRSRPNRRAGEGRGCESRGGPFVRRARPGRPCSVRDSTGSHDRSLTCGLVDAVGMAPGVDPLELGMTRRFPTFSRGPWWITPSRPQPRPRRWRSLRLSGPMHAMSESEPRTTLRRSNRSRFRASCGPRTTLPSPRTLPTAKRQSLPPKARRACPGPLVLQGLPVASPPSTGFASSGSALGSGAPPILVAGPVGATTDPVPPRPLRSPWNRWGSAPAPGTLEQHPHAPAGVSAPA